MKRYIKPIAFVFLIIFVTVISSSVVFAVNDNTPAANAAPDVAREIQPYNADVTDNVNDFNGNGSTNDQTVNDTTHGGNGTVTGDINNNDNVLDDIIPDTTVRNDTVTDVTDAHDTTNRADTTREADTTNTTTTSGNDRNTGRVVTIIVSLVIIAAVIILIIAFIPRRRHDR